MIKITIIYYTQLAYHYCSNFDLIQYLLS